MGADVRRHVPLAWMLTLWLVAGCGAGGELAPDVGVPEGGLPDLGAEDSGAADVGVHDHGAHDHGAHDHGAHDAEHGDTGAVDPNDPDADGFASALELACGTDPGLTSDFPDPSTLRGAGTAQDPYRICFAEHLVLFALEADVASAHARLGADLDFSGVAAPTAIGSLALPYVGDFDGAGHAIVGLTLGSADEPRVGLFERVGPAGGVRDLGLIGATSFLGSPLVHESEGRVLRVFVDATSVGPDHAGLVVNVNLAGGLVADAVSAGSVAATHSHVGGLVGQNDGTIERCSSSASVTGEHRSGGLVGSGVGVVRESFATGAVVGSGRYIGGLVGSARAGSLVADSFALGSVSAGMGAAGGVVGNAEGDARVERVYAQNEVSGSAAGAVLGEDTNSLATLGACYFDADVGGADARCTGLDATQLATEASYVGFDFTAPVWVWDATRRVTPSLHWE